MKLQAILARDYYAIMGKPADGDEVLERLMAAAAHGSPTTQSTTLRYLLATLERARPLR